MFYTEAAARKKMCPIAGRCVGSECMAWRWADKEYKLVKDEPCPDCPDAADNDFCDQCHNDETYGRKQEWKTIERGYCGLAPQK